MNIYLQIDLFQACQYLPESFKDDVLAYFSSVYDRADKLRSFRVRLFDR